jgi:diacylglycerol kinase (ATP)
VTRELALLPNPVAGKGRNDPAVAAVAARLREAGLGVRELRGTDAADSARLARAAVADGVDGLVVCGGDGMVNVAAQVLAGSGIPLGIIAMGTGNDTARSLGLPVKDPLAAADVVVSGRTRVIDLARSGDRYFVTVLAAGFDAVVNERARRMRWPRGQMRYNLAVLRELPVFRPIPYVIELDGRRLETRAMLVAVANTTSFGGGMKVCPGADVADGLLDVMVVHALSIPSFLRVFPKVYSGAHTTHPAVEIYRARRVRLEASGIHSQADGEAFADLPVEAEVVPGALAVVVPADGVGEAA